MMALLGNSTFVKLVNVDRFGFSPESSFLTIKGTWFPSQFSLSVCDNLHAWTISASEDFVNKGAETLYITDADYIDRAHSYFSKEHPDIVYELRCGRNATAELSCLKRATRELVLRVTLKEDKVHNVAFEMFQFLVDAHSSLSEDFAKATRTFERTLAAEEQIVNQLKQQKLQLEEELHVLKMGLDGQQNGVEDVRDATALAVPNTQVKRKGEDINKETGSRKRNPQRVGPSETLPVSAFRMPPSPGPVLSRDPVGIEDQSPTKRLSLSLLGWKQPLNIAEEAAPDESNCGSWIDKGKLLVDGEVQSSKGFARGDGVAHSGPVAEESLTEAKRKGFLSLDNLSDVADLTGKYDSKVPVFEPAKNSTGKKPKKAGGAKTAKKQAPPSAEPSLDVVDDIVEKGIKLVEALGSPAMQGLEVLSPLTTPVKQNLKPAAKKPSKPNSKVKKNVPKKINKKVVKAEAEDDPSASLVPDPPMEVDDRIIRVQNPEFHDFDQNRSENDFMINQFWALYDDHDGQPRFYGRICKLSRRPFSVSVEWLEPVQPNVPAGGLVKSAGLSASCGDFNIGTSGVQELPAFSHIVEIERDKKGIIRLWPAEGEVWALYRLWDKKQPKGKGGDDEEFKFDYDVVKVQSKVSASEGVKVAPLKKVQGFKSLFSIDSDKSIFSIPYKQVQGRFSHRIPEFSMCGGESPGVPPGSWELDPASTPAEFLGRFPLKESEFSTPVSGNIIHP